MHLNATCTGEMASRIPVTSSFFCKASATAFLYLQSAAQHLIRQLIPSIFSKKIIMSFREVVQHVLDRRGMHCSAEFLSQFSDEKLAEVSGLPSPDKLAKVSAKQETITFEGDTSSYVRMDLKGLQSCLKGMKAKNKRVIASSKIRVEFDFGLDQPYIVWLFAEDALGFTRKSLATAISKQYIKLFSDKKRYRVWCAKLSHVHLFAIYFDPDKNVYRLDVDLHN